MPDVVVKKEKVRGKEPPGGMRWRAPEYEFSQKSSDWFWIVGIITIALVFASIILKNILFGALAAISGFSLAMYGARKPSVVSFELSARGIGVGDKIYDYENLKRFWLNYDPPQKKDLLIESKKTFMSVLTIPLADEDPNKIRGYLQKFLPEGKIEESLTTTIARVLKI